MAITNSNASVSDKPPKGVMIPRAAGAPSADEKAYAVSMNQVARHIKSMLVLLCRMLVCWGYGVAVERLFARPG